MKMFHEGDIQSGIFKALQEQKPIVCFIAILKDGDETAESKTWHQDYLIGDSKIHDLLTTQAIILRIEAGSQDFKSLAFFCPVSEDEPSLKIIRNSQLIADVSPPITLDALRSQLEEALSTSSTSPATSSEQIVESQPTQATPVVTVDARNDVTSIQAPAQSPAQAPSASTSSMADIMAERRARLERDVVIKRAEEKAKTKAKSEARKEEVANAPSGSELAQRRKYMEEQKRRKDAAKADRERVLQRIEDDKKARKEAEQIRKMNSASIEEEKKGRKETGESSTINIARGPARDGNSRSDPSTALSSGAQRSRPIATSCALQVRLFDGSTIRKTFPKQQTLSNEVRAWIDADRNDGDAPYTLRQILAPAPNRQISISEEEGSLEELGLVPNATLVMVPVREYSNAYSTGGGGLVSRTMSAGYGLAYNTVGTIAGTAASFLGIGAPQATVEERRPLQQGSSSASSGPRTGRSEPAASLAELRQRDQNKQPFYNGNQLNTEPRPEDLEERED